MVKTGHILARQNLRIAIIGIIVAYTAVFATNAWNATIAYDSYAKEVREFRWYVNLLNHELSLNLEYAQANQRVSEKDFVDGTRDYYESEIYHSGINNQALKLYSDKSNNTLIKFYDYTEEANITQDFDEFQTWNSEIIDSKERLYKQLNEDALEVYKTERSKFDHIPNNNRSLYIFTGLMILISFGIGKESRLDNYVDSKMLNIKNKIKKMVKKW